MDSYGYLLDLALILLTTKAFGLLTRAHQPAAGSRGAAGRAAFRAGLFGSLTSDGVYLSGIRNRCDCSDVLCRTGDGYR